MLYDLLSDICKVGNMAKTNAEYNESSLIQDLKRWWDDQVGGSKDDPFAMPTPPKGTIFDVLPAIDSLGVVSGLITIEKHIGIEVPATVIRKGGYKDFQDLTNDLLPKVKALVEKKKQKPNKRPKKEAA